MSLNGTKMSAMVKGTQQVINHENQINTARENEVFMSPIFGIEIAGILGDGYTSNDPIVQQ